MKKTVFRKYIIKRVLEDSSLYNVESSVIRSPDDAVNIMKEIFKYSEMTKEHFTLLTLDTKNKVIGSYLLHVGSLNASIVHPRDVLQAGILDNAASFIVAHNHPSGDPTPSQEDINVTRRLKEAGQIMGIELLDHMIIGDTFISLKEKGYL